jgi:histidinol-phosphate/aromatic aminotransferase/cobyric acid decarboxylase-like protein
MEPDVRYISSLYGGFWNFGIKDFCYLVNTYFPPSAFTRALGLRLDELLRSYPSTNWYISSLVAKTLSLTEDQVVIGNGASELISTITNRYVDNLAVPIPTFDEYVNRATIQGKTTSLFELEEDFSFDADKFIQHINKSAANSALIINPNNPTGTLISQDSIWYLLESLRQLDLIILDESFLDFSGSDPLPSAMGRLFEFPNLVILKSLSKVYGIAGLRLGYAATSNRTIINALRKDMPIWSINSFGQFFLEEIGNYQKEFLDSCAAVREATQVLYHELQSVSYLSPYPSEGNFVLCKIHSKFTGSQLTKQLYDQHKIFINDCSGKKGLTDQFVRIASRTTEENVDLARVLRSL